MKKKITRKQRKVFLMLIVIFITAVTLAVETYAWFVGLSTVNTNSFNISISSGSGLEISMDGEHWHKDDDVLIVNAQTIAGTSTDYPTSNAYSNNINSWVDSNGLVPVSSSGVLDTSTGRLNFFEKSSLSSTAGGYRLVADPIDHTSGEAGSYVAFDVFIRNGKDNVYANTNYDDNVAENIYLKTDSYVAENGATGYGAANSIRVGFFMLAGMKSYGATVSDIQGLSCSTTTAGVKRVLCPSNGASQGLYWNIWEPNQASHTVYVSSYFSNACKNRNSNGTYTSTACTPLSSSTKTYPIYASVGAGDYVDIYDGLNNYTSSIYDATNNPTGKLSDLTTYKSQGISSDAGYDTQLFKLAGNSITRVRVYIWLEGQDPDNYDLITGDLNVRANFGFTKERYELEPQYVYSLAYNTTNSTITGTTYSDFKSAKTVFSHPAAIAYILNGTTINKSYVAFERNGIVYYLRGRVNESNQATKPVYESNVNILKRAFGPNWQSVCTDYTSVFDCSADGFSANASFSGTVSAYGSGWSCDVAGTAFCNSQ